MYPITTNSKEERERERKREGNDTKDEHGNKLPKSFVWLDLQLQRYELNPKKNVWNRLYPTVIGE